MRHNLSEITDLIKDRRSIAPRNYSDRVVQKEIIEDVLRNGSWAPTHGMTQPWRFKVYRNEALIPFGKGMAEIYKSTTADEDFKEMKFEKIQNRMTQTSVVIAVCMKRDPRGKIREIEEVEAVACCIQNMYLTCTAYGLGSYWSSPAFMYEPKMNEYLGLDPEDKCLGLFYIGYPNIEWPKGYRKPLEDITEWIDK